MTLADGSKVEVVSCEAPVIIPPPENQTGNVTEPIPPVENNTSGNVTEPIPTPPIDNGSVIVTPPENGSVIVTPPGDNNTVVTPPTNGSVIVEPPTNTTSSGNESTIGGNNETIVNPPAECQPGTHNENGTCIADGFQPTPPDQNVSSGNLTN
jgi:hypothetical protein